MPTEREKMVAGELYDPLDPELVRLRERARDLCWELNASRDRDADARRRVLAELLGAGGDTAWVQPPFFCDYGWNLFLGEKVFFNFNCVVLDVAPVRVGSDSMFGPGVQLLTATHPLDPDERRRGREGAKPITIGADVWVGGGAVVCPGVTVGDAAVIGAGSVVTRDVPPGVIAVGNPCRVVRPVPRGGLA